MNLQALYEKIHRRGIPRPLRNGKRSTSRPVDCLVALQEKFNHLARIDETVWLAQRGQLEKFTIGPGCRHPQRPNSLGHLVDCRCQLCILMLEHHVKRLKHRPGDVPVKVMSPKIERIGIR